MGAFIYWYSVVVLIVHGISNFRRSGLTPPTAVTIGNFDGCHLGHQQLIATTKDQGRTLGATTIALTFDPRPEAYFNNVPKEWLLFSKRQKSRALQELGLDAQIVQAFDGTFAATEHEVFYSQILRETLGTKALVVGENFRFGKNRLGDGGFLAARGDSDGIRVTVGKAVTYEKATISSTRIRETLKEIGNVESAAAMLGRPYMLEGIVRQGDQLGRKLGVPTANLEDVDQLVPKFGVYAGHVWLGDAGRYDRVPTIMSLPADAIPAVFSIGVRPTIGGVNPPVRIEAHLLRGTYGLDDLYGRSAGYYLTHRLRGEDTFADLNELKAQMARDMDKACELLGV